MAPRSMHPTDPATPLDPGTEQRLRETELRLPNAPERPQRRVEVPLAVGFLVLALGWPLLAGATVAWPSAAALVVALAAAYRIDFIIGVGAARPTELLFVPLLLGVPAAVVPAFVAAAVLVGRIPDVVRGTHHPARLLVCVNDAWYAIGPALVLAVWPTGELGVSTLPLLAVALAAQVAADALVSSVRMRAVGVSPRGQLRELLECWLVDVLLAPVGLAVALAAAATGAWVVLLALPLGLLLQWFAREREARLSQAVVLSETYRRVAFLLGDVIGDDDDYTGQHTHGVVAMAGDVAEELGLDEAERQLTELGALLHDVGKIQVPNEIINKPGPLDDDEWAVMRTHTVLGQDMLDRVGGWLTDVGVVVRASHERWDGGGYPDGLAGEEIPLPARIVAVCDALSAMTTDRSYRKARPLQAALDELRACAGTHFCPRVVAATCAVMERTGVPVVAPLRLAA